MFPPLHATRYNHEALYPTFTQPTRIYLCWNSTWHVRFNQAGRFTYDQLKDFLDPTDIVHKPGKTNGADYLTKHQPTAHHRIVHSTLHPNSLNGNYYACLTAHLPNQLRRSGIQRHIHVHHANTEPQPQPHLPHSIQITGQPYRCMLPINESVQHFCRDQYFCHR